MPKEITMNEDIKSEKVLLVGQKGEKPETLGTSKALRMAEEQGVDLVVISPGKDGIPVVRIIDRNKYLYEQKKQKKGAKPAEMKELKIRPGIAGNDLNVKVGAARKFLTGMHEVKLTLMCRGREIGRIQDLSGMLSDVADMLSDCSTVKSSVSINGKTASLILSPKKP